VVLDGTAPKYTRVASLRAPARLARTALGCDGLATDTPPARHSRAALRFGAAMRELPGNQSIEDALASLVGSGGVVAFAGAGVGSPIWPLWQPLLRNLSDAAVQSGRASPADVAAWSVSNDPEIAADLAYEALGPDLFAALMREYFRRPEPRNGRTWTPAQELLVTRPFKALVTTNYDPGLLDARIRLRVDVLTTGYTNSADGDALAGWITGDVLDETMPVLYLHGAVDRPSTMVLTQRHYRTLYARDIVRQCIRALWEREHFLFVGFSFRDARLSALAELAHQGLSGSGSALRHFALVPLEPSIEYSPALRRSYEAMGGIQPIFYYTDPAADNPHEGAQSILSGLPPLESRAPQARRAIGSLSQGSSAGLVTEFAHEGTQDEYFVERPLDTERMTRWCNDPTVRTIAITGLGGIGKTALTAKWLTESQRDLPSFDGAFFWSFYSDPNPEAFFEALVAFGERNFRFAPNDTHEQVEQAGALLRSSAVLVVLDGLEIVQEVETSPRFGSLTHQSLRQFANAALRSDRSAVVFTSRFPLADLDSELGRKVRWLPLARLAQDDGIRLLSSLGVVGTSPELGEAVEMLEGHPLGLRVLANTAQSVGSLRTALSALGTGTAVLESKLLRLVDFYLSAIGDAERSAFETLALFRTSVDIRTIAQLRAPETGPSAVSLTRMQAALDGLVQAGMCTRERRGGRDEYACHPVLREACRLSLLRGDSRLVSSAVDLLAGKPGSRGQSNVEFRALCDAVVLMLQVRQPFRALSLVQTRLQGGETFLARPALAEANEILAHMVNPENWQTALRSRSVARLVDLAEALCNTTEAARLAGDVRLVSRVHQREFDELISRIDALDGDIPDFVWDRLVLTRFRNLVDQGRFGAALESVDSPEHILGFGCWRGHVASLRGEFTAATADFDSVRSGLGMLEVGDLGLGDLVGYEAIWWTEHLLVTRRVSTARAVARRNELVCRREPNYPTWSSSLRVLGLAQLAAGEIDLAKTTLMESLSVADRTSQFIHYLESQLACALTDVREGRMQDARSRLNEVIAGAGPRDWRLLHIDALDLRAVTAPGSLEAGDDEVHAASLANRIGYARRVYGRPQTSADALPAHEC
jgi:SIR2-like domain